MSGSQELEKIPQPAAYMVMYSVIDKASFQRAEDQLSKLHELDIRGRPIILIGNKIDLVRSRVVSSQGKHTHSFQILIIRIIHIFKVCVWAIDLSPRYIY